MVISAFDCIKLSNAFLSLQKDFFESIMIKYSTFKEIRATSKTTSDTKSDW